MSPIPQVQRVAAYAVVLREGRILLSRLSDTLTTEELWTLPGGGLDHGEDPRQAVVREVYEETGLDVEVAETARVYSAHQAHAWRHGRRVDAHSLRIVYDGWVPVDAPEPRTVEVGGSTAEAAWVRLVDVLDGTVPTVPLVIEALAGHDVQRRQRVASYALVEQDSAVLLARVSTRGFHTGLWTLPGGGLEHGESPADAVVREVREECGLECEVSSLLLVADERVRGTAPAGRDEDFHSVQLVFAASVPRGAVPRVTETDGTTDAVAWVPLGDVRSGAVEVHDLVRTALGAAMLWR